MEHHNSIPVTLMALFISQITGMSSIMGPRTFHYKPSIWVYPHVWKPHFIDWSSRPGQTLWSLRLRLPTPWGCVTPSGYPFGASKNRREKLRSSSCKSPELGVSGWWFGTWPDYDFPYIGEKNIPTDFHSIIFRRGRSTTNQAYDDHESTAKSAKPSVCTYHLCWATLSIPCCWPQSLLPNILLLKIAIYSGFTH